MLESESKKVALVKKPAFVKIKVFVKEVKNSLDSLFGDALAVGALEEVRAAGGPIAVSLVAPVAAVVVEVATPKLRDALLAVGTGKLKDRLYD
jgi:hypothetical protein